MRREPAEHDSTLDDLQERLGHRFTDVSLLDQALRHRSWCAENGGVESNERLEFLGDAVLGWAIADISFRRYPELPEGGLTDLRKSVVSEPALAMIAKTIDLGAALKLGDGEVGSGGSEKPSLLSDALEAVLAAVYLDAGAEPAFAVVERLVAPHLDPSVASVIERRSGGVAQRDPKTALQELCARQDRERPTYVVTSVGPPHAPLFTADVMIDGRSLATAEGGSKKAAEQAAAALALAELG